MDVGTAGGSVSSGTRSGAARGGVAAGRKRRNRKSHDHRFANYLTFGFQTTICLGLFVLCYALVLLTLWPLLGARTPESLPDESPRDYIHHMHVPPSLKEAHIPALPNISKDTIGEMASGLRKRLQQFRQGRGVTDANFLDQARAKRSGNSGRIKTHKKWQRCGGLPMTDPTSMPTFPWREIIETDS